MAVYKNSVPFGNIVTDGLVLNLDATNINSYPGSGTTWTDTSFYRNNGTLTNGPTFLHERGRGSIVFDGVDDIVSTTNYTYSTTYYSQFLWYKFLSHNAAYEYVFDQETSRIILAIRINNVDALGVYNSNQAGWVQINTSSHLDGKWKYIGVTNNNGSLNFYINGTNVGNSSIITNPTNINKPIAVGGYWAGGGASMQISNAQIYNRALSAQEVQQNFNALKSRFGL